MHSKKIVTSELVTKNMLTEAVDSILEGMDKMFSNLKETIDKYHEENAAEHADIKRQISDLKHDTPTIKEFNELKVRVDNLPIAS